MKIVLCSDSFIPVIDGVGRVTYEYAQRLSDRGNECYVVTPVQKTGFRGLPTPAMALFVASLQLALAQMGHARNGVLGFWACLGITLLFSFMMVCNRSFFSFKMKKVSWKGNEVKWIFLILAIAGFAVFRFVALPFVLLLYILLSVLFYR